MTPQMAPKGSKIIKINLKIKNKNNGQIKTTKKGKIIQIKRGKGLKPKVSPARKTATKAEELSGRNGSHNVHKNK